MSIRPGRYIITNAEYWNFVFLSDNSDGTSLQACLKEDVPGQEWNISEHGKGRYSIINFGHKMWASAGFRPEKGEHVVGREALRVWLIKKHESTGNYTIATPNDKLRWWLDDSEPETPITLHSAPPSDPRCHWNFQRIGHVDIAPYEAVKEEAVVAKAELMRKAKEVEVARGELVQAKAVAAENATRREEAEAEASSKAADVEAVKREAAGISEELQEARQEVALAKSEVSRVMEELEVARKEMATAKRAAEKDAARRKEAESETSRKAEELEHARREVAQSKAEAVQDAARREEAEAEASRNAARFEEAKKEAVVAKEEVARRSEQVEKLKREVAQAKDEAARTARELEAAKKRLKEMEPVKKVVREAVKEPEEVVRFSILPQQDPLAELADANPGEELNIIVKGAFNSLRIIEPWCGASTDHPQLHMVIQKVQSHSMLYFEAIETSIKTAQDGYDFSHDAIVLCRSLLDPETSLGDLQEYISDIKSKAKHAHEDTLMTLNKFRDVRKDLIEITKTSPKEVLPGPRAGDASIGTAIKQLNLAALDMAALADNVDKFAGWWSGMETVLGKSERSVSDLKPGKDKLRVKVINKTWEGIRDDYEHYKVQILRIQGRYHQEPS